MFTLKLEWYILFIEGALPYEVPKRDIIFLYLEFYYYPIYFLYFKTLLFIVFFCIVSL